MSSRRFMPSTSPVVKTKFKYRDETDKSNSSSIFVKISPDETQISQLPSLCLKNGQTASTVDIYIDDVLVSNDDLNKKLRDFGSMFIVRFKSKAGINSTFYTIKNIDGKDVTYIPNTKQDFLELVGINEKIDKYIIFDQKGNKVNISNDNYNEIVKEGDIYYVINYPRKLDSLTPPKLFDEISKILNIKIADFRQFLCILNKLKNEKELYKIIVQLNLEEKSKPFSSILDSFSTSPDFTKDIFLHFVFSILFIKGKEESYLKLFERISKNTNIFSVFDSRDFVYKSQIPKNTIIKINEDIFGVYIGPDEPGSFRYYDPYENKEFLKSIDYSDIEDPSQITAIFVDTSGSMVAAFNHTRKKLYEAAVEIANELITNIHNFRIYDSLIVSTSSKDKLESNQINHLTIGSDQVYGRTNIWDKLDFFLKEIKSKKNHKECPSRILIITDGEDTNSSKSRDDILKQIHKEKIIVDSIILCDDEFSQDPSIFSIYTNGVYLFATDIEKAKNFVSLEPFFNLSIRKSINTKKLLPNPFGKPNKKKKNKYQRFEQLEPFFGNPNFYTDFDYGLLKPSPNRFIGSKNILAIELLECLKKEEENPKYFTFLIQNSEDEDKNIEDGDDGKIIDADDANKLEKMLNHWCVFIKFESKNKKRPYFWQMKIDFDSKYPDSFPTMRIVSHPELIKGDQKYISPFGTIRFDELLRTPEKHYTISKLLDKLIDKMSKKYHFDYDDFNGIYINSPVTVINTNLSKIISINFENGWENNEDDDEAEEEEKKDEKVKEVKIVGNQEEKKTDSDIKSIKDDDDIASVSSDASRSKHHKKSKKDDDKTKKDDDKTKKDKDKTKKDKDKSKKDDDKTKKDDSKKDRTAKDDSSINRKSSQNSSSSGSFPKSHYHKHHRKVDE